MTNRNSQGPLLRSTALIGSVCAWLWASDASAQPQTFAFDIPQQSLSSALREYGQVSGQQLIFTEDLVAGRRAPALHGNYTAVDALSHLLVGTDLVVERSDTGGAMIRRKGDARPIRLGDASRALPSESGTGSAGSEEIVVTAQKREERLKEVPVSVSVIKADKLTKTEKVLIRDYYTSVPGLSVAAGIYPGPNTLISIRGVNTGVAIPTVGILIDDVPFGSTFGGHGGLDVPDIDPGDLARVEVLRGPQGTLYGSDSMGGLLKFVTVDPSTSDYSGRIEVGTNDIDHGAEPGYNFRASANIPITDTLAIRVSGFRRQDPGYVDNVGDAQKGVNQGKSEGGRLSALWHISDDASLKLSALYQYGRTNGAPDVNIGPGLKELQQSYLPGVGGYKRAVGSYSAILNATLGNADLTSITGYGHDNTYHSLDYSAAFGAVANRVYGVTGAKIYNRDGNDKVSEEIRLSGTLWQDIDWLVGAYYSHETNHVNQDADAVNPLTNQVVHGGLFLYYFNPDPEFEEYAGFADLTYHFTDRFDIQVGGRQTHIGYTLGENTLILAGPPTLTPREKATADPFTYLVTPRFKVSDDLMVYARFASGFRPGAPNTPIRGVPSQVNPDTTQSYEAGVKGDFLGHVVSIDASLYYIAIQGIQLSLRTPNGIFYRANGGDAKSQGAELSLTSRPATGLTIAGWVDYDDAVLTSDFPAASTSHGLSGDRLPRTSKWSGNISLEQEFSLGTGATWFVGGEVSFVGNRIGNFQSTPVRQIYPSYVKTDLRAGVNYESWIATIYANNVADERGVIGGGLDASPTNSFTYIEPRTVGVNIAKTF